MKCKYDLCNNQVKGDEFCCLKCNYFADMDQLMTNYISKIHTLRSLYPLNMERKTQTMEAMYRRTIQYVEEQAQQKTAFDKWKYEKEALK